MSRRRPPPPPPPPPLPQLLPPLPPPRQEWAYFFDLDGTLIDFADTPAAVHVSEELCLMLERLYRDTGGAVALMSGRAIADIDRLFPHARLPSSGQHGAERRNAAGHATRYQTTQDLAPIRERLAHAILDKPGLLLEDKGLSLALHFRRAPVLAEFAHRTMEALVPELGDEYGIQNGKGVVELKPAGRDKGRALLEFMGEPPFAGRTPVFVGDDATDEFGFDTVNQLGGLSVKVGTGDTVARWRLENVRAVQQWLRSI